MFTSYKTQILMHDNHLLFHPSQMLKTTNKNSKQDRIKRHLTSLNNFSILYAYFL